MSVKAVAAQQYRALVNNAASQSAVLQIPTEGWVRTTRTALGMTGAQLARRAGVAKSYISRVERAEPEGAVTLRSMQQYAAAMNCRFVYAIVPEDSVEGVIERRAREKSTQIVASAGRQMALEAQQLGEAALEGERQRLARDYIEHRPGEIWSE